MIIKKDFPILKNNDIVFLDSTSSTQKPNFVIDGINDYLKHSYSNIHRGMYDIAKISEDLYTKSKQKVCEIIGSNSFREIIYTYNANYAVNIITQTLRFNKFLKAGDKVLLSIVEHHANIVPWLILKQEIGIEIDYINIDENYDLDLEDFEKKYDETVKVISVTHVSNVTGQIFQIEKIGTKKRDDTLFIVDASQSIPHFNLDVKNINCDLLVFTGHKIMSDTGIGVIWGKQKLLESLKSVFSGGGAISNVEKNCFYQTGLPDKFEPGTPNITGAVSLLRAIEYIENIGGYKKIEEIEKELIEYALEKFNSNSQIKLIGSKNQKNRLGVFSFVVDGIHSLDIAEFLANKNICIRAGQHCAEPFLTCLGLKHTCRMSLYIYNTKEDIDIFFESLEKAILELK